MKLFSEFLSDHLVNALGWSLFHILWQGFVIAIFLGLLLWILRNKAAQIRYLIAFSSLLIFVGLTVFNFSNNFNNGLSEQEFKDNQNQKINEFLLIELKAENAAIVSNQFISGIKNELTKIDKHFPVVVNVWIIGLFVFILKLILGFIYSNRLKFINTNEVCEKWIQRFQTIQHYMKVNRTIRYIESNLIKVPMVIGYFKPVVIIPVEMLTQMPFNQIEAIIAHEIAHIRRNDYIFNVLQTVVETLFFFHPAVWYISNQIRKERENCCDDLALSVCEESLVYAKALVSIQQLTFRKHYSAVAFSGKKKHLLNRVKRLIMKPKVKSNLIDRIIAAVVILSGVLALSFTYSAKTYNYPTDLNNEYQTLETIKDLDSKESLKPVVNLTEFKKDTLKSTKGKYNDQIEVEDNTIFKTYRKNGTKHQIEFKIKNGKAYDLYINEEKIPEKEYSKYQDEIDETINDLKEAKDDIREAMKDIEEVDYEQIHKEVKEAMKDVHIDVVEIQEEIAKAMEEVEMIDVEDIMKEVEMNMEHLENLDFDFVMDFNIDELGEININLEEIRVEMAKTHETIKESIDVEVIEKEMQRIQEELNNFDKEKIQVKIEESLRHFEENDKQEIIKELEEKLEELEELELEEK